MRDSFLRRAGATRFSVMVALIGTFRAGPSRKERKEAERLCLPFRQASHFRERKFTRLSSCSGFKGTALNGLLPPLVPHSLPYPCLYPGSPGNECDIT